MTSIHRFSWVAVTCLAIATAGARANSEEELRDQQEKQRQVQAETDHVVRRITTMLRVMQFYNLESSEQKIMQEMKGILSGLSKRQMAEVIRQLESAAEAKDEKVSEEAHDKAYDKHREVVRTLHEMLARFDAIKSLDQAADRFEKYAKLQLDLHLQSNQSVRDLTEHNKPDLSPTLKLLISKRMRTNGTEMKRQSDNQNDLERDVTILVKQVKELAPKVNPEQQERVKSMNKLAVEFRLFEHLTKAAKQLRALGYPETRLKEFRAANELQWMTAGHLRELARVLRMPGDTLAVLKEARDRVDQAIAKQDEIRNEAKVQEEKSPEPKTEKVPQAKEEKKEKLTLPGLEPLPKVEAVATPKDRMAKAILDAVNTEKNADIAKKQAQLAFDTKDTANLLKPVAAEAAEKLATAEKAMKDAKENLLKNEPKRATAPQEKATEKLKDVRAELDTMIAAAEKAKTDPLAAAQKAIENLDNLIKEQAKTQDETKETVGQEQNLKLPELAEKQKELANKTEEVKNAPLPNQDKVEAALEKAAREMKNAAKKLDAKKSGEAVAKQEKALDALKEARKELADKVAEIEKRRDDIAKLEAAAEKLGDLAKDEKKVADKADANANQEKTEAMANKDLAKEQGDITPKANDLAKELSKTAPEAAEKVAESTKNMQAAKKELEKNQTKPGAAEAKEAGKKLDGAKKALENALNDLKGKEIADQAALQKNQDPAATAQQVAKALEQANKAADAAKDAQKATEMARNDDPMGNPPKANAKADLAAQQAEIAKKADQLKLPEAAKVAKQAAEAIKNGDIPKALENQGNALKELQEAAKKPAGDPPMAKAEPKVEQPMPGEPKVKEGDVKPGDAKPGEKPAQAKQNVADAGAAKGNADMKEEPMAGDAKAADAKSSPQAKGETPLAKAKDAGNKPAPAAEQPMAKAKPQDTQPKDGAKEGQAQAAQAKEGEPMQAQAKDAGAEPMAAEKGEGNPMAQAKAGEPADMGQKPDMQNPAQLAQQQKALMDATKALAQSKEATQAAQAALAQAQAQAPQAVQPQLKEAAKQLQDANKQLQDAKPGEAGEAQMQAAQNLDMALQALTKALAQADKAGDKGQQTAKGEPGDAKEPGMGEPDGQGKEPGDAQGEKPGQGQAKGKEGKATEQNEAKGEGDRKADGNVSNKNSKLTDANGDGAFLHLPPRQRELIRQAISGNLPPEYANLIQQYYINIARGRAAAGTSSAPAAPPPQR